ncbi:MAG TPA: MSMEG_0565 family glycosyltransferase [Gemmatimonadales bacterium]|nr:MSMEG_0565 family glycosyltransferase [Gemmatimonadales bacterium]
MSRGSIADYGPTGGMNPPRVAMVTFSTRPRGGAVHALHLAESLFAKGQPVHVFALGNPDEGFFRETSVPHAVYRAPEASASLEEKVALSVQVLTDHLATTVPGRFDIIHAQDCIAARAACQMRAAAPGLRVVRTVHHLDDFSTPALIECQHRSILEPDHVLVVSRYWRRILQELYGIDATVVTNGVDGDRFHRPSGFDSGALRARVGSTHRPMFLTVGGIDPRKGSLELVEAMARVKLELVPPPVLVLVGGHSFRDHSAYRELVLQRAQELGLVEGKDFINVGTVSDQELPGWYHAADAFVFPSVKEGWGLAVLEALAAGLPVLATDIEVFREYLSDDTALLVPPGDAEKLASALVRLATDANLRETLARSGPQVAARFTWDACADRHIAIYETVVEASAAPSALEAKL